MQANIISKNDAVSKIVSQAMAAYFKQIVINHPINKNDFIFEVTDSEILFIINEQTQAQFNAPYRLGDLLSALQKTLQNQKIKKQLSPIKMGKIILDPQEKILDKDKKKIRLTDKEFDILYTLYLASPNKIQRDKLLHQIWGYGDNIETHTLETHIYRLRQKIETDPTHPNFLKTDDDGYFLKF